MNATGRKRLLKLADFLDKLPRAKFDFSLIAQVEGKSMAEALKAGETRCGTVGCAVGWMPAAFPRHLKWGGTVPEYPDVCLRSDESLVDLDAAGAFFGIEYAEVEQLFVHGAKRFGYSGLRSSAAPKDVAKNIRKWVREQEKANA